LKGYVPYHHRDKVEIRPFKIDEATEEKENLKVNLHLQGLDKIMD
jgi:hypothetical protein